MARNRFETYRSNQYTPQFIPTPLDTNLLMKGLATSQQQWDTAMQTLASQQYPTEYFQGRYHTDRDVAKQVGDYYENATLDLTEQLGQTGDVSKAATDLIRLKKQFSTDPRVSGLAYRKKLYEDFNEQLNEADVNDAEKELMREYFEQNLMTDFGDKGKALNRGVIYDTPDIAKKIKDAVSMLEHDGGVMTQVDGLGRGQLYRHFDQYGNPTFKFVTATGTYENLDYGKALNAIRGVVGYDPEVQSFLQGRETIGRPYTQELDAMLQSAAFGKSFNRSDIDYNFLDDPYGRSRQEDLDDDTGGLAVIPGPDEGYKFTGLPDNGYFGLDKKINKTLSTSRPESPQELQELSQQKMLAEGIQQFNNGQGKTLKAAVEKTGSKLTEKDKQDYESFVTMYPDINDYIPGWDNLSEMEKARIDEENDYPVEYVNAMRDFYLYQRVAKLIEHTDDPIEKVWKKLDPYGDDAYLKSLSEQERSEVFENAKIINKINNDTNIQDYKAAVEVYDKSAQEFLSEYSLTTTEFVPMMSQSQQNDFWAEARPIFGSISAEDLKIKKHSEDAYKNKIVEELEVDEKVNFLNNVNNPNYKASDFAIIDSHSTGFKISYNLTSPDGEIFEVLMDPRELFTSTKFKGNKEVFLSMLEKNGGQDGKALAATLRANDSLLESGFKVVEGVDYTDVMGLEGTEPGGDNANLAIKIDEDGTLDLGGKGALSYGDLRRIVKNLKESGYTETARLNLTYLSNLRGPEFQVDLESLGHKGSSRNVQMHALMNELTMILNHYGKDILK